MAGWSERQPLKAYLRHQAVVDRDLRRVLMAAANDARAHLAGLDPSGLRAAQLRLQEEQLRMWARIGLIIEDGLTGTADVVVDVNKAFTDSLLESIGAKGSPDMTRRLQATAQESIRTYMARQRLGMTLSERVYRNGQVASGRIDRLVNNGLLRGATPREIARDVHRFISPRTPGGSSYAAMRLGRTEVNNAYHEVSAQSYNDNPFVDKVLWNLSASHPRPDACDDLVGRYSPNEIPRKPHPQCFCYTTPEVISLAALTKRFRSGEFNEWAEGVA